MRAALAFLTLVGGARTPDATTLRWFPLAGAVVGAIVGASWWAASGLWPPLVAAALAVTVDLAVTGLLHLDGLADSGDGLVAPMSRERRLQVMAAPDVGAFGIAVVIAVVLLRWSALAVLAPSVLAPVGLWAVSRTLMAVTARSVAYARPEGLARAFLADDGRRGAAGVGVIAVVGGLIGVLALTAVTDPVRAVLAVGAAVAGGIAVVGLAVRRLGGFTGDVLGAAGLVAETVGLLALAAR